MLSDEEREAIESLKNIAIYIGDNYTFSQQGIRNLRENLRIVLPVIEKQSKEIEELHKEINQRIKLKLENERCADEDFIYKDKIKAKIEEIDREIEFEQNERVIIYLHKQKIVLQSLLDKE